MNTIDTLRGWLDRENFKAFIAPSCDPHQSEYVADRFKVRGELSGFDGSAGTVVVALMGGALWTDSRYFLQAVQQLEGSSLELMKMGVEGTPSIEEYLSGRFAAGDRIAIDGKLVSASQFETMRIGLLPLELVAVDDPFDALWHEREPLPTSPLVVCESKYCGASSQKKVSRLKESLSFGENSVCILTTLDAIAWLTNCRGADVEFNPLNIAYCAVENNQTILFVKKSKVSLAASELLKAQRIEIEDYDKFEEYLTTLAGKDVIYSPAKLSYLHFKILIDSAAELRPDPVVGGAVDMLKACKDNIEIDGFRRAMIDDGVAMVRFMMWLEDTLAQGKTTSELEVAAKLYEFRAQSDMFRGESFASIVGYESNGAIVHYRATEESSRQISSDGFLLIDSGGQYLCGTTDITRTIHLGTPSEDQVRDYTLVLKGNINLSRTKFPKGTRGSQLDFIARKALSNYGLNYHHGTGHGVGHYLCVHEGPQSIRKDENPVTLEIGMVLSNEPGLYRTGEYGIRLENMMFVKERETTEFDTFYEFETLTLAPFSIKCINIELLLPSQRKWLNSYHSMVYDKLSPHLLPTEREWLATRTKAI